VVPRGRSRRDCGAAMRNPLTDRGSLGLALLLTYGVALGLAWVVLP
jgi:hypothetical protein